ncbi:acyltransferase [Nocardiopsis potens]|uniref:acyltransferase n=1 Tax=Nocardiopsis potens TaxID=1246458 RepID=UPI00034BEB6B|nr:acyltransferase family protein [Nocardiopsis potens]
MRVDDIRADGGPAAPRPVSGGPAPPSAAPAPPRPSTAWIDFARVCAMGAVVLVHAVAPLVTASHTDLGTAPWWAANTLDAAARWCVPVFVMISGALLLAPKPEAPREFYRKRWARIGLPLVAWTAAYLLWEVWRNGMDAETAWRQAASGAPSVHLYFLYVIAGLYLLTPFLRTVVAHTPRSGLWWFAGTATALGVADQALSLVDGAGGATAATRFLPFLGYYLLGWLLHTAAPGARTARPAAAVLLVGTAATAGAAWALADSAGAWEAGSAYVYDYLSPTVLPSSVGAFLVLRAAGLRLARAQGRAAGAVRRAVGRISALSFGVYLVHVMVLYELRGLLGAPDGWQAVGAALGYAAAAALLSLAAVAVVRRIPGARALLI